MKVKPKEVLLNLPVALLFDEPWEITSFAANINAILHGKVRLKVEELGVLGGRHVGLFYLQRNDESQEIHDEFMRLIEEEEFERHTDTFYKRLPYVPLSKKMRLRNSMMRSLVTTSSVNVATHTIDISTHTKICRPLVASTVHIGATST